MLTKEEREFCGWFWGEGSFNIKKVTSWNSKTKKPYYQSLINIVQREDDPEILNWCKRRFGGSIYRRDKTYDSLKNRGYIANPRLIWQVGGFLGCWKVVNVLKESVLPAKKRKEMKIFIEFLDTRIGSGRETTKQSLEKQEEIRQRLHEFKQYKPPNSSII